MPTDPLSPAARQALVRLLGNEQHGILTHRSALHNSTREALIRRGLVECEPGPSWGINPHYLWLTSDGVRAAHSLGVEG